MTDPIASLRSLHEEATSAEWAVRDGCVVSVERQAAQDALDATAVEDDEYEAALAALGFDDPTICNLYTAGEVLLEVTDEREACAALIVAARNNLPALLDAAELLRTIRGVAFAAEIDAVLSRLHVEDTP